MAKKPTRFEQSGYFPGQQKDEYPTRHGWDGNGYFPGETPDAPAPKPPRRWSPARIAVLALCAAVFVFAASQLIGYFGDVSRSDSQNRQLREEYRATDALETSAPPEATPAPTAAPSPAAAIVRPTETPLRTRLDAYPNNPTLRVSDRLAKLRNRNRDIAGWITIDGLLDQVVMQRDNSYYLRRDYLGYHNVTGALFFDEHCALERVPEQLIIHGHNMKTGAMFGILKKYKTSGATFLREHPYIQLGTLYEDAEYVIFAVAEIDTRPDHLRFLNFMGYPTFATDAQFMEYVRRVQSLSYYDCPIDVRRPTGCSRWRRAAARTRARGWWWSPGSYAPTRTAWR